MSPPTTFINVEEAVATLVTVPGLAGAFTNPTKLAIVNVLVG